MEKKVQPVSNGHQQKKSWFAGLQAVYMPVAIKQTSMQQQSFFCVRGGIGKVQISYSIRDMDSAWREKEKKKYAKQLTCRYVLVHKRGNDIRTNHHIWACNHVEIDRQIDSFVRVCVCILCMQLYGCIAIKLWQMIQTKMCVYISALWQRQFYR